MDQAVSLGKRDPPRAGGGVDRGGHEQTAYQLILVQPENPGARAPVAQIEAAADNSKRQINELELKRTWLLRGRTAAQEGLAQADECSAKSRS